MVTKMHLSWMASVCLFCCGLTGTSACVISYWPEPPAEPTRTVTIRVLVQDEAGNPFENVRVLRVSSRYTQAVGGWYGDHGLTGADGQVVLTEPNVPKAMSGPLSVGVLTDHPNDPAPRLLDQETNLLTRDLWSSNLYSGELSTTSDNVTINIVLRPAISIEGRVVLSEAQDRVLQHGDVTLAQSSAVSNSLQRVQVLGRRGVVRANVDSGGFVLPRQTKNVPTNCFFVTQHQVLPHPVAASDSDIQLGDIEFQLESAQTGVSVQLVVDPARKLGDTTTDGFTLIRLSDQRMWTFRTPYRGRSSEGPVQEQLANEIPRASAGTYAAVPGSFWATGTQLRVFDAIVAGKDVAAHGIPVITIPVDSQQPVDVTVNASDVFEASKVLEALPAP